MNCFVPEWISGFERIGSLKDSLKAFQDILITWIGQLEKKIISIFVTVVNTNQTELFLGVQNDQLRDKKNFLKEDN